MKRHFVQCMDLPMSFCVSSIARFVPFLFWGRFARHHPKKVVFYWNIKALTPTPNKTRFASVDVWLQGFVYIYIPEWIDWKPCKCWGLLKNPGSLVGRQSIHFLKDTVWPFTIHCEPVFWEGPNVNVSFVICIKDSTLNPLDAILFGSSEP